MVFRGVSLLSMVSRKWLFLFALWFPAVLHAQAEAFADRQNIFAIIDGQEISGEMFVAFARERVRQKYYHAAVPDAEKESFLKESGKQLIDRILLLREAKKREVAADEDYISTKVAELVAKNADNEGWEENGTKLLAIYEQRYRQDSLLEQIERLVREVPEPSDAQVRAYYDKHPEKFTQPARARVSVILLKVPPYADSAQWQSTYERAKALYEQLQQGGDFAALAREHSDDPTAEQGGDMGFVHQGTLGGLSSERIEALEVGEFTEPLQLLEGAALLKLTERLPSQLMPFDTVEQRARALLRRDLADLAWQQLLFTLNEGADIAVNESYYQNSLFVE